MKGIEPIYSSDENECMTRRKSDKDVFKIILIMRREDEQIRLNPIPLIKELRKKLCEIEMAKILYDGNILVKCKTEEQKNKAMAIGSICKKTEVDKKVIGGKKGTRGVIWGIPIREDLDTIKKNNQVW